MPLVEVPVPNLLGGVSEQPPSQRTPGQVEACDNALLHVVNGLSKRPGTRHLAKLITGLESVRLVHLIDRDPDERYVALVGERRVRVFDATDGTEFPVRVNGTSTPAGRGERATGTPINYLDPRAAGGELDQDEDFVIGAGDWLSDAGNSVTSYVSGRGPFKFGRRESLTTVNADTVAEVGNGAAATVSDIHLAAGTFSRFNVLSVFVKKSTSAISDVELTLHFPQAADGRYGARFDIDSNGVVTVGAIIEDGGTGAFPPLTPTTAEVESVGNGWYRCSIRVQAFVPVGFPPVVLLAGTHAREAWIRFHTNAATPANKRALLFGARLYDTVSPGQPVPAYVHERSDLFRALTISDTTLLLNTEKTVAMAAAAGTVLNPIAGFVFVRLAIPGAAAPNDVKYVVTVKYLLAAVLTTQTFTFAVTTSGPRTDEDIAEGLRALIDAHADLVATRVGSVIRIVTAVNDASNRIHAVETRDSRGDTLMVPITLATNSAGFFAPAVTRFTDLPRFMDDGYVVAVIGDPERPADDYYVEFIGDETGSLRHGNWAEGRRAAIGADAGMLISLDETTLPVKMTRLQDDAAGTKTGNPNGIYFDVSAVDWDDRLVGDEVSNPVPSFVGQRIQDLFLYRGRLGFLADDNVVLSEAGEVFNFWRTTVLDLPDTDPIDVSSGSRESVIFRNAAATADNLLLLSDRRQYQLLGDPVLTPATAQLAPVRAFESLPQVRPVDSGRGVVFARSVDTFSGLMEAVLLQDDVTFRFDDLTVQAPRYIPGRALELAHSSLTGLTVASSEDAGHRLFLHQTFHDDQENRLQSALHRWVLDADAQVRGMGFLGPEMRLVTERAEGWFLETVLTDPETTEGGRPIVHLDRRVHQDQVTMVYAGGPDETTITLPYNISGTATMQVVDAASGLLIPILSQTTTTVVVRGDVTASDLYVGERFDLVVVLTEPVIQEQGARGFSPRMGRVLNVNRLYLYLADTAYLEVEVALDLRTPRVAEFSAAGLGTGLLTEGELNTYTGDAQFGIIGRSTELTVTLRNPTPFPSYVQSARWACLYFARASTV